MTTGDRIVVGWVILAVACEAGAWAWYGRRHHDQFLAKKLVRIQHKASREPATGQQSTTVTQTSPTDLPAANANSLQQPPPTDLPAANATAPQQLSPKSGPDDLLEQLKKLGDLRDTGVLTEEEFQRMKAEILHPI
jgi:hypothetical protein